MILVLVPVLGMGRMVILTDGGRRCAGECIDGVIEVMGWGCWFGVGVEFGGNRRW